jgi:hypothetical protein
MMPNRQQQPASIPSDQAAVPQGSATPKTVPWYRRSGWVTAMVGGILLLGPLLAPLVLLILFSGPVYARKSGDLRKWEASTKGLVAFFALLVMLIWLYEVFGNRLGPKFQLP